MAAILENGFHLTCGMVLVTRKINAIDFLIPNGEGMNMNAMALHAEISPYKFSMVAISSVQVLQGLSI